MKILQDGIFEIMCEFHEDLKQICNELNLKSAKDVIDFLDNTPKGDRRRLKLDVRLSAVEFAEKACSMMIRKGQEATRVGDFESVSACSDLIIYFFYEKVEKIKIALNNKGINFNSLSLEEKFKQFQNTLIFEDEQTGMVLSQMFLKVFFENTENKDKQLESKQLKDSLQNNKNSSVNKKHLKPSKNKHKENSFHYEREQ